MSYTNIKYIMLHYENSIEVDFVIFNKDYIHLNVRDEFLNWIGYEENSKFDNCFPDEFSAGFIILNNNLVKTVGNSESLNVKSHPEDAKIINKLILENSIDILKTLKDKENLISFVNNKQVFYNWRYDFLKYY